jgi:hypothetical protein
MNVEYMKIKRSGFVPLALGSGILAAAFPVLNMAVRPERYLNLPGSPVEILMQANWSLMAMLNVLLVVAGACLLYHIEYADNGMQKMESLPVREGSLFFGKNILMALMVLAAFVIEAASLWFCAWHWFGTGAGVRMEFRGQMVLGELGKSMGYSFLVTLPCVAVSLLLSQVCRKMWVSLGIGVICVFTATMLPTDRFLPSLFPYAMPFQVLPGTEPEQAARYLWAAAVEAALAGAAAFIMIRVRRWFA